MGKFIRKVVVHTMSFHGHDMAQSSNKFWILCYYHTKRERKVFHFHFTLFVYGDTWTVKGS